MNRLSLGVLIRALFSTSANPRDFETAGDAVELTMKALSFNPFLLGSAACTSVQAASSRR